MMTLMRQTHAHPLFATMLLAWSVTESIRYPFYALALFDIEVYALNWLRYNTFLVLYPLGASSEAFLALSTVPPLSSLPYIHYFFAALHAICLSLPAPVLKQITHTKAGRHFLYSLARAKAAQKTHGITWSPIQVVRLVLFVIWWPGGFASRAALTRQPSTSSTLTCSSSAASSSPRTSRPSVSARPTRPTRRCVQALCSRRQPRCHPPSAPWHRSNSLLPPPHSTSAYDMKLFIHMSQGTRQAAQHTARSSD